MPATADWQGLSGAGMFFPSQDEGPAGSLPSPGCLILIIPKKKKKNEGGWGEWKKEKQTNIFQQQPELKAAEQSRAGLQARHTQPCHMGGSGEWPGKMPRRPG